MQFAGVFWQRVAVRRQAGVWEQPVSVPALAFLPGCRTAVGFCRSGAAAAPPPNTLRTESRRVVNDRHSTLLIKQRCIRPEKERCWRRRDAGGRRLRSAALTARAWGGENRDTKNSAFRRRSFPPENGSGFWGLPSELGLAGGAHGKGVPGAGSVLGSSPLSVKM